MQRKKRKHINPELLSDTEETLRIQRIKLIMNQKQDLATIKLRHEENISKIKEDHLKQLNEIEIQHKKEIHKLEMEIKKTKLKIVEKQYH